MAYMSLRRSRTADRTCLARAGRQMVAAAASKADTTSWGTGMPSLSTRSSMATLAPTHGVNHTPTELRVAIARVESFAAAIAALPHKDAGVVRRVERNHSLVEPTVVWENHGSGDSLFEHLQLLPRLQSVVDDDMPPLIDMDYDGEVQVARRLRGGSYAMWQMAEAGCVTTPHIDDDNNGDLMDTYLVMVEGEQVIVAWWRDELHEDEILRDLRGPYPSLSRLHALESLTIVRAIAGDVIHMPRAAVHMVLTVSRKVHLAYHIY